MVKEYNKEVKIETVIEKEAILVCDRCGHVIEKWDPDNPKDWKTQESQKFCDKSTLKVEFFGYVNDDCPRIDKYQLCADCRDQISLLVYNDIKNHHKETTETKVKKILEWPWDEARG